MFSCETRDYDKVVVSIYQMFVFEKIISNIIIVMSIIEKDFYICRD